MSKTVAQKMATMKYDAKTYDRLSILVHKGRKAELQAHAKGMGESLNGFVTRSIDTQIQRDAVNIKLGMAGQGKAAQHPALEGG